MLHMYSTSIVNNIVIHISLRGKFLHVGYKHAVCVILTSADNT